MDVNQEKLMESYDCRARLSLRVDTQIHHAGRSQAGHRSSTAPRDRNQCCLLEVRRHQVQEKRGFPGRHRVCQPPGMLLETQR